MFSLTPTKRFLQILMKERQILISGNLTELGGLLAEKEALLGKLQQLKWREDDAILMRIRDQAAQNEQLFEAAKAGLKTALHGLDTLTNPDKSSKAYGKTGQKISYGAALTSFKP